MKRVISLLLLALASTSCGQLRYAYAPVTTTSAEVEGHAAAILPIEDGKGELRVASLGVAQVTPPSNVGAKPFRALFVRFVVQNQSNEEWSFDQSEQRVDLEERGIHLTRWASTATGERPPVVRVAPRSVSSVDLLFSVGQRDEGDLSRFEVVWTLGPGGRVVTGRAAFTRQLTTREPSPAAFDPETATPYPVTDQPSPLFPRDPCLP